MGTWDIEFKYYNHIDRARRIALTVISRISVILAASLLILLVYEFGFLDAHHRANTISVYYEIGLAYFVLVYFGNFTRAIASYSRDKFLLYASLLKVFSVFIAFVGSCFFKDQENHTAFIKLISHHYYLNLIIVVIFFIEVGRASFEVLTRRLNPAMIFIGSFTFLILVGAGLLLLPNSTTHGISIIDALFTSTSAVCVTGLICVDTATAFTPFGKVVIIVLIQMGGLGVMTFTTFFGLFYKNESTFQSQVMLKEILNLDRLSGIFRALLSILIITLVIELIGAFFIFQAIADVAPLGDFAGKVAFSAFHSISAFCNAGFSTLTDSLYTDFLRHNYSLHFWIMVLIVFGGLGFPIIFNYMTLIKHFVSNKVRQLMGKQQRYMHIPRIINMNARIVVFTTAGLILFGAIMFFLLERNNTLAGEGIMGKIMGSFFGSISPRTAGFNTIDVTKMLPSTILITIFLMWVGASPGSTGGGIKTTTFALALFNIINLATGRKHLVVGRREIPSNSVQRAFAVIFLSVIAIGFGTFLVMIFQPSLNYLSVLFEATSAFSTVGLSVGITSQLTFPSKIVMILLMFIGRVGLLSLIFSFLRQHQRGNGYRLPSENIYIN